MDAGSGHGLAGKGSVKDLEVGGSDPVGCYFSIPSSFFTLCSSHYHACMVMQTISFSNLYFLAAYSYQCAAIHA